MELLKKYFKLQEEIYDYFGYKEGWVVIPINNSTEYYWSIIGHEKCGSVRFSESETELLDEIEMDYYENEIYTLWHLPKWVYRGEDYTMICVDTHTDGNKFLQIFDNKKEIKID